MRSSWGVLALLVGGLLAFGLGLLLLGITPTPRPGWTFYIGLGLIALSLIQLGLFFSRRYGARAGPVEMVDGPQNRSERPSTRPQSMGFVETAINPDHEGKLFIAGKEVSEESLVTFGRLLTNPRNYTGRIVERLTPMRRLVREEVSMSLMLDFLQEPVDGSKQENTTTDDRDLLFPLEIVRKGQVQDNFRVRLEHAAPVSLLTYEEYCELMVITMRLALASVEIPEGFEAEVESLLSRALELIVSRQIVSDDYSSTLDEVQSLTRELRALANTFLRSRVVDRAASTALEWVATCAETFYDRHPIVLILPRECIRGNRTVIKFQRDSPAQWRHGTKHYSPLALFSERISAFFGCASGDFEANLGRAARAQSYHAIVVGPEESYLSSFRFRGQEQYRTVGNPRAPLHMRARVPKGQNTAHAYVRNIVPRTSEAELLFNVSFHEVPPFSVSRATIVAFAATMFIYVAGLLSRDEIRLGPPSIASTLVLGAVAVVAAWTGLDRRSLGREALVGDPIAKISSFITVVVAVVAGVISLGQQSDLLFISTTQYSVWGLHDWTWIVLTIISATNGLWCLLYWVGRSARYMRTLRASTQPDEIAALRYHM